MADDAMSDVPAAAHSHLDVEDEEDDQPQRKRSRPTDDDEDGGDSGSEGEVEKSRKKKKHRKESRPGAQFIDNIAVNEDDEEEPDEDDDEEEEDNGDGEPDDGEDLTDERAIRRDAAEGSDEDEERGSSRKKGKKHGKKRGVDVSGEDDTMHMTLDQQRDREETAALAAKFESRYKDDHYDENYDEDGANRSSSGAVLPSVRDPSLFVLRVGKKENPDHIVKLLLEQYYKRELDPDKSKRLHITSVFTTPIAAQTGRIYIEAFREVHVEQAVKSLPIQRMVSYFSNSKTNIKIAITEMVTTLKINDQHQTVKAFDWVRFSRGPCKGDLAQVVGLQDQGSIITVKFVPRLDHLYLEAKSKNEKLTQALWKQQSGSAAGGRRPPQKYFEEGELRRMGLMVEKKRGAAGDKSYYLFNNGKYKNGFQFKDVKIDGLDIEHVNPSEAEIERFTTRANDSDDDDDPEERKAEEDAIALATEVAQGGSRRATVYSLGDRVQIMHGALRNVTGRVTSINKERLVIQADLASIPVPIEEMVTHVRKFFSIGAHVKVVTGVFKNETGMICHVPDGTTGDDKLAIHTDISQRTIEVSAGDVIESSEVSTGRDTFGSFELYDLVQMSNDVVGVIVGVHMASFNVLTDKGAVQLVKLQEIQFKRNDRFSHTMDKHNERIERDDVVTILFGPHRGKRASAKHIFKRQLFVHSREVDSNGGMFVIPGNQAQLIGGRAASKLTAPRSPGQGARSPGPAPMSPGRSGPSSVARPTFGRDPLVGRDVKVTGGPYKGYAGVVTQVFDAGASVQVEFRAIFRKTTVPRAQVMEVEVVPSRGPAQSFYGSQTPLVGGATPAHTGFGNATPGHEMGGSMTPAHLGGSRTPSQAHRTPSHTGDDVWAAQTPAHRQDDRMEDEAEDETEEWRIGMGLDAAASTPLNPLTPGAGAAVPMTPAIPATPMVDPYAAVPATPYGESAPAAADEPVAGLFTSDLFIGCHVLVRGGPTEAVISRVVSGGASVYVRPVGGGRESKYTQADLSPVPAGKAHKLVMFLTAHERFAQGDRMTLFSIISDQAMLNDGEDFAPIAILCACDPAPTEEEVDEEADEETPDQPEEEEEAATQTKQRKKKGKSDTKRK